MFLISLIFIFLMFYIILKIKAKKLKERRVYINRLVNNQIEDMLKKGHTRRTISNLTFKDARLFYLYTFKSYDDFDSYIAVNVPNTNINISISDESLNDVKGSGFSFDENKGLILEPKRKGICISIFLTESLASLFTDNPIPLKQVDGDDSIVEVPLKN